ncbi:MAG: carbon monoxide dehydrogenase [Candidatus Adiutrix intracellularis]|jgi:CO dehydrogenase maturation factor|nr:MAG: carbon monoxide dehydrogenase [Candidatus Adiutrix intracellularis]MDR2826986.1 AAA family ATPase [Candidatus Adiutrix intracellularis]
MKIAISGKGGVGKTTFSATLAHLFKESGKKVLAIDADPDANLAATLGYPDLLALTPISEMKELVAERTGSQPGTYGSMFTINPKVDDLPDTLAREIDGIKFMTLGGVKKGGGGCICPESTMLKNIIMHLVLARDEVVIMDMEAGLEHLGRATASGVDHLITVVEPGQRSIETARTIRKLANDLYIKRVSVVGNKIRNQGDREFITKELANLEILGFIPFADSIIEADRQAISVYKNSPEVAAAGREIFTKIIASQP